LLKKCARSRGRDASLTRVKLILSKRTFTGARLPGGRCKTQSDVVGASMHIRNLTTSLTGTARVSSATIAWEDRDYRDQTLTFAIAEDDGDRGGGDVCEPSADAFLAACFPLAAVHGEARVRIEGQPCPMLVEGLRTAHAWWTSWGGMPTPAPEIETLMRGRANHAAGPRRAVACLSGGVDGLHMLLRNRQLYRKDDPAYIRDALLIHGFDIGKRARDPENERYRMAFRHLEPLATEVGVRLISCFTNLRHLPTQPGFWTYRHNGAALAAVGHAAIVGPGFLFIGGTFGVANPVPMGSHPAVDASFSSQRLAIVHDGARYSRVEKVRELAAWPSALAALRVCPEGPADRPNCGRCEKCLRTRLELLAAGIEATDALGPSLTPMEQWIEAVPSPIVETALYHQELLGALRKRGHHVLCRVLEEKIIAYREGEYAPPAPNPTERRRLSA
jgi:hypothetical protein